LGWRGSYHWADKGAEVTVTWEYSLCFYPGRATLMKMGRQSNTSRGLALYTEVDILHRSIGCRGSVPDPGPPSSHSSGAVGPPLTPESPKTEKGINSEQGFSESYDLVSMPNFKREKSSTRCSTTLFVHLKKVAGEDKSMTNPPKESSTV